jgi:hypothetical protein
MFARSIHKANAATRAWVKPQLASRICQVPGCSLSVPQNHLMCRDHWYELPSGMRIEVVSAWTRWYGGETTMRPYMAARLAAIVYIGKLHGIDVTTQEAKLIKAIEDLLTEQQTTPKPAATS